MTIKPIKFSAYLDFEAKTVTFIAKVRGANPHKIVVLHNGEMKLFSNSIEVACQHEFVKKSGIKTALFDCALEAKPLVVELLNLPLNSRRRELWEKIRKILFIE